MLIDDFTTSRKRSDARVARPPQQSLNTDSASEADTTQPVAVRSVLADNSSQDPVVIGEQPPETTFTHADPPSDTSADAKKGFFSTLSFHVSKKQLLIAGIASLVVIGGGSALALKLTRKEPAMVAVSSQPTPTPTPTPIPTPVTEPSRLSGAPIAPELNKRNITGIMIENSLDARPQSGLLEAGVVFEAIAEGGITRFLALYQENRPGYIGPVRSLRPYYIDWLMPFDATIAHVGGSLDALQQVRELKLKDLDQFQNGGSYFRTTDREAPHNVYTTMEKLDALTAAKGWTTSTFTAWPRKADQPAAAPQYSVIDLSISSALYNVHYDYDKTTNVYFRSEGGKPHVDEKSNVQITPKSVVALVMPYQTVSASDGYRSSYGTVGSGPMYLFQDGIVVKGTWKKPDRVTRFSFFGPDGAELPLNPGQAWLTVVEAEADISYK